MGPFISHQLPVHSFVAVCSLAAAAILLIK
jgi:hypothetical protein